MEQNKGEGRILLTVNLTHGDFLYAKREFRLDLLIVRPYVPLWRGKAGFFFVDIRMPRDFRTSFDELVAVAYKLNAVSKAGQPLKLTRAQPAITQHVVGLSTLFHHKLRWTLTTGPSISYLSTRYATS